MPGFISHRWATTHCAGRAAWLLRMLPRRKRMLLTGAPELPAGARSTPSVSTPALARRSRRAISVATKLCSGLLGLMLQFSPLQAAPCERALRMAMMEWPPYFYSNDAGEPVGADIEMIRAIFKEAACTLELRETLPRNRRYAMFKAGDLDIIPGASDTPERREYAWFGHAYRLETVSLFTLPAKLPMYRDVSGFQDLLSRRIGLLSLNAGWFGADYDQYIGRLQEARLSSTFESFEKGLMMLARDRGELIMADHATLLHEAARLKMELAALNYHPSNAPVHLMFNKKTVSEEELQRLNAAQERLEARGVLRAIRLRYNVQY